MQEMKKTLIILPWAPSANEIWRNRAGSNRPHLSSDYRRFLNEVAIYYKTQGSPRIHPKQLVEVTIRLFPPTNRSYDVDNRVKPTLDSLTKTGLWLDDRYVRRIEVIEGEAVKNGAVAIEIIPLDREKDRKRNNEIIELFGLQRINKGNKQ